MKGLGWERREPCAQERPRAWEQGVFWMIWAWLAPGWRIVEENTRIWWMARQGWGREVCAERLHFPVALEGGRFILGHFEKFGSIVAGSSYWHSWWHAYVAEAFHVVVDQEQRAAGTRIRCNPQSPSLETCRRLPSPSSLKLHNLSAGPPAGVEASQPEPVGNFTFLEHPASMGP